MACRRFRNRSWLDVVVGPAVKNAGESFLASLDAYTIEDLCQRAEQKAVFGGPPPALDFAI